MRSPDGAPRDGYLRLADVYGLSLPADLLFLALAVLALAAVSTARDL